MVSNKSEYMVYWEGASGERTPHGTYSTSDKAFESILEWWEKNDFEPPYIRSWKIDNIEYIDYGSHACFYLIKEV